MKSQKSFKIPLLSNSAALYQYIKRSYDSVNGVGRSGLTNMKDTYVMLTWLYELAIPSTINWWSESRFYVSPPPSANLAKTVIFAFTLCSKELTMYSEWH